MIILSAISLLGLVCAAVLHFAALARCAWTGGDAGSTLGGLLLILGLLLLLITVIRAWDWSLGGFWDNLVDGMPWLARTLVYVAFIYPCIINGVGSRSHGAAAVYQAMHPEYNTAVLDAWLMSSLLLPLFFLPMVYFWKEREVPELELEQVQESELESEREYE